MKIKYLIYILVLLSFMIYSCSEDDEIGETIIPDDSTEMNDVDKWINDSLTKIYNMEVKYRWDDSEVANDKILAPPYKSMVIPFLDVMNQIWIKPYAKIAGVDFMKRFVPKQLVLVGSYNFNQGGTITLGQAEGGRKVVIFNINYFDKTNREMLKQQFHTLHHEFAHILHQTKMYDPAFKQISAGNYTSQWADKAIYAGHFDRGFITPYSMSMPTEDFVEIIATILTDSPTEWAVKANAAGDILNQKIDIVVNYFSEVWEIDIFELQAKIDEAVNNL